MVDEGMLVLLRLNTVVELLPLPLFDDADVSSASSDCGAGDGNFGIVYHTGVSVSARLMRGNADIDL